MSCVQALFWMSDKWDDNSGANMRFLAQYIAAAKQASVSSTQLNIIFTLKQKVIVMGSSQDSLKKSEQACNSTVESRNNMNNIP